MPFVEEPNPYLDHSLDQLLDVLNGGRVGACELVCEEIGRREAYATVKDWLYAGRVRLAVARMCMVSAFRFGHKSDASAIELYEHVVATDASGHVVDLAAHALVLSDSFDSLPFLRSLVDEGRRPEKSLGPIRLAIEALETDGPMCEFFRDPQNGWPRTRRLNAQAAEDPAC